jgi:hypothetical protein
MAETGQLAAWAGREKGFEDGHITRGAIAPN